MRRLLVVFGLVCASVMAAFANAGAASDNTGSYEWLAGVEPILEGPDVAVAADGSTIALEGEGTFSHGHGPSTISGGGEFTITDANGVVVASGEWSMTQFEGFVSYGGDPAAPDDPARGGTLHAAIVLEGVGSGHIWLYCLVGSPPPSKPEGIRVDVGRWHFDEQAGGETVFIKL